MRWLLPRPGGHLLGVRAAPALQLRSRRPAHLHELLTPPGQPLCPLRQATPGLCALARGAGVRALLPGRPVASGRLPGLRGRAAPRVPTGPGRPTLCRLCWRCALGNLPVLWRRGEALSRRLLRTLCPRQAGGRAHRGPEGRLRAVYEAIVAAPQPYSAHNWLRRSVAAKLLGEVAAGQLALTHEALDAHRARRGADYLRHLLVANGVLSARDDALVRLEAWVAERLASVEDRAQRRRLRSYATWRVLRRARQRAEAAVAPRTATRHAKVNLNSAIAFLAFLAARQVDLAGAGQADLDDWLAEGPPSAPEVRDFLGWAADRRLSRRFDLPGRARQEGPIADDDERWATARSLLHDEGVELGDRVAGLLVLLYGQQLSRIAALTRDQVELGPGRGRLHLGATALDIPSPLAELFGRLVNERRPYAGRLPAGVPPSPTWLLTCPPPCWLKLSASPRALLSAGPEKPVPTGPCTPLVSPVQPAPEAEADPAASPHYRRPPRGPLVPGGRSAWCPGSKNPSLCVVLTRSIATMETPPDGGKLAHCTRLALCGPPGAHLWAMAGPVE